MWGQRGKFQELHLAHGPSRGPAWSRLVALDSVPLGVSEGRPSSSQVTHSELILPRPAVGKSPRGPRHGASAETRRGFGLGLVWFGSGSGTEYQSKALSYTANVIPPFTGAGY